MNRLRLYLLRHAQASRGGLTVRDIDRSLAESGRSEMDGMARLMVRNAYMPERIVCSSARRTRETLAALLPHLPADLDIGVTRRVYEADDEALLAEIARCGGEASSLLLIGHNPGIEDLARMLVAGGDAEAIAELEAAFPTAALAVIDLSAAGWREVGPQRGHLAAFHTPRKSRPT